MTAANKATSHRNIRAQKKRRIEHGKSEQETFWSRRARQGDGSGGLSGNADIPENMVLSNRDKSLHPHERGQDGKWVQAEQRHNSELHQKKI
jgi:hypothetical protein